MSGPPHAATNHYLKAKDTNLKRHKYICYTAQIHKYTYIKVHLIQCTNIQIHKYMNTCTLTTPHKHTTTWIQVHCYKAQIQITCKIQCRAKPSHIVSKEKWGKYNDLQCTTSFQVNSMHTVASKYNALRAAAKYNAVLAWECGQYREIQCSGIQYNGVQTLGRGCDSQYKEIQYNAV